MGFTVVSRKDLTPKIHRFEVDAPTIAKKAEPGQFVIVRVDEKGERIPLTLSDWDREKGTVSIVFNVVGRTTKKLGDLKQGDQILNFAGPFGTPSHIDNFGTVLFVVGGYWIVAALPLIRELKAKGNDVISIMRAPSKDEMFGEKELENASDEFILVIGEGSYESEGFVLAPLRKMLENDKKIDRICAFGPICMMKYCALLTKKYDVPTMVSLNPIMVDGTGMCGCCRVKIGTKAKFACVDGPEFDGHQVDWDLLTSRRCTYFEDPKATLQYRCNICAQW